MSAAMPAITVYQPWASLIVLGVKPWETRPSPPNGDMRPPGVRGLPGLRINRGDRIAIHAAARRPDFATMKRLIADDPDVWAQWHTAGLVSTDGSLDCIPTGAIVGFATVVDVLPITDATIDAAHIEVRGDALWLADDAYRTETAAPWACETLQDAVPITDQLPYGDWTPGRWAWQLADIEACDPIPAKGRQGVWTWTP